MKKLRGVEHHKLQAIAANYNYCLLRIEELRSKKIISNSENEIIRIYQSYIYNVRKCFSRFNGLERTILEREYFTPLPTLWWQHLYSRATYYRLRLSISKKFLLSYEK